MLSCLSRDLSAQTYEEMGQCPVKTSMNAQIRVALELFLNLGQTILTINDVLRSFESTLLNAPMGTLLSSQRLSLFFRERLPSKCVGDMP